MTDKLKAWQCNDYYVLLPLIHHKTIILQLQYNIAQCDIFLK